MVKEDRNTKRFENIINRMTSRFVKWSQCNREVLDLDDLLGKIIGGHWTVMPV